MQVMGPMLEYYNITYAQRKYNV